MKKNAILATVILLIHLGCSDQDLSDKSQSSATPVTDQKSAAITPNAIVDGYHVLPGVGDHADGAGIAAADINGNGIVDMIMMANDIGNPGDEFRYYVAYDLNTNGEPASLGSTIYVPGLGSEAQGAGIALGDIDRNGALDLLLMHYDAPSGPNQFRYKIGWNINGNGVANSWSSMISVPGNENDSQGAGVSLVDFDRNGMLDIFLMSYNNPPGANDFRYKTGFNLSTSGIAARWGDQFSTRGVGNESDGAACGITKYNGTGTAGYNVMLMSYDDSPGHNTFRYKLGCNLVTSGIVTCGWYPSTTNIQPYMTVDGMGSEGEGAGMTFADVDRNGVLDMIFMAYDDAPGANSFRYRIGFNIERTAYPPTVDWR